MARARGHETRDVHENVIRRIHKSVTNDLEACAHLFDSGKLYDTESGGEPILIATFGNGKGLTPVKGREREFERFMEKGRVELEEERK